MTRKMFVEVVLSLLLLAAATSAQQPPQRYLIAVSVECDEGRIQSLLPQVRKDVAEIVENASQNADAIIVVGKPGEAAEQGRERGADFLLRLEPQVRSSVTVETAHAPAYGSPIPGTPRGSEMQGIVGVAYTVESLKGQEFRIHATRTASRERYPLGPTVDWLTPIVQRTVRDSARAAVHDLKSKKGFEIYNISIEMPMLPHPRQMQWRGIR